MADNYNENKNDEVVDSIPKNAQNINDNTANTFRTSVKINSSESSLLSIVCLGLGIFSVICCCTFMPAGISSIIGLIMGFFALKNNSGNKTAAIIGIILCAIGLAMFLLFGAFAIIAGSISTIVDMPAAMQSRTM